MQFEPKPISKEGIPAALEKAHRYRLLNEPAEAESICLDVLAADPDNQQALDTLLLAITDQLGDERSVGVRRAREVLARVSDEYRRSYYGGIICERYAMALLHHDAPRSGEAIYESLRDAMRWYERAESLRPPDNDEAILRWNSCARVLARHPSLAPATPEAEAFQPSFD
jgi:hypothetical protein